MSGSSSPESADPDTAFFTSPESADSLLDDNYPGYDGSTKEDSESPPAEEVEGPVVQRRQPSKTTTTRSSSGRPQKSTRLTAKSASVSRAGTSSHLPIIPRKAEDWDPWKSILHELYITQNRILRDIINIMDTTYNLKATPKMYKNQFARWGFFKYAVKRRPRIKSDARAVREDPDAVQDILLDDDDDSLDPFDKAIIPMIHQNDSSRAMQLGMTAVQNFLHGYIDVDATRLNEEAIYSLHQPMYRYFKAAMDLFDQKENIQGGQVLRLAFLQIEPMLSQSTIKSFADLCLSVPHLLLESDRKDILAAYLQYLSRLATVKYGHHPLGDILASFTELLHRPEDIMRYIMILSQVNAETLSSVDDMAERTQEWAKNLFLGCQRTINNSSSDGAMVKWNKHDHHMIRLEAQGVYWAQKLLLQDPEADDLATQWLHRKFEPDFAERAEAFHAKMQAKIAAGQVAMGMERLMESLSLGWLNDYYESREDWPKVFEWGKKGLALADNEQYAIWSINLEQLMRKYGSADEADELRRKRQEHRWLDEVRRQVEELSL